MIYNRFYFIYSLTNSQNQKRYIGYTNDLNRRLFDHLTQLELGQHPNKKLQEDYKEEYFEIEVLATYVNKDNDGNGDMSRSRKKSFFWYKNVIETNGEEI